MSSAAMLQQLLPQDDATIVAESSSNSVIVRATPLVMAEVEQVMEALAGMSFAAYRRLIEHPSLVTYFQEASPVEEMVRLKLGSRPARRFGAKSLDDLRAIPWVFAWSQNRHLLPGWYGVGSAINGLLEVRGEKGLKFLQRMYRKHDLFRLVINEVTKTLMLVDLDLARRYADLVEDKSAREEIFQMIETEYNATCEAILKVSEAGHIGEGFEAFGERLRLRLPALGDYARHC